MWLHMHSQQHETKCQSMLVAVLLVSNNLFKNSLSRNKCYLCYVRILLGNDANNYLASHAGCNMRVRPLQAPTPVCTL